MDRIPIRFTLSVRFFVPISLEAIDPLGIHPPQSIMEPKNEGLEDEPSFQRGNLSGSMLVFRGVCKKKGD